MEYKFKCEKCGKIGTVECSMEDYDEIKNNCICDCGGNMKRVFEKFTGGIEFIGPGFYNTENGITAKWQ